MRVPHLVNPNSSAPAVDLQFLLALCPKKKAHSLPNLHLSSCPCCSRSPGLQLLEVVPLLKKHKILKLESEYVSKPTNLGESAAQVTGDSDWPFSASQSTSLGMHQKGGEACLSLPLQGCLWSTVCSRMASALVADQDFLSTVHSWFVTEIQIACLIKLFLLCSVTYVDVLQI